MPKGYNFGEASGVDVDRQGNVWVFNRGHWPVMEFDRGGKMLQAWTEETFRVKSAHGLRVGPDGSIWCVDVAGHVVFRLSPEGRILMVLGNRQGNPGNNDAHDAFYQPTNLAFRPNGNFYVSDGYINSRVIEFNPQGEYVRHWGRKGTGDGEFNYPGYLALDRSGALLVTDALNYRVQAFDRNGKFLWKIGHHGDGSGDLASPKGVAVDSEGDLYVVDAAFDAVQLFDEKGGLLLSFGDAGPGPGEFWLPEGAFINKQDRIYVADSLNGRIQIFEFLGGSQPPPANLNQNS